MSIRIKLIISFIIMLIISFVFTITSFTMFSGMFFEDVIHEVFDEKDTDKIIVSTMDVVSDIEDIVKEDINLLYDEEYMAEISERLSKLNVNIEMIIDDRIAYSSNEKLFEKEYRKHKKIVDIDNQEYWILEKEFESASGNGYLYLAFNTTDVEDVVDSYKRKMVISMISLLGIMISILLIIITNTIIKPLKKLEYGTHQIKNGNLDFTIKTESHDEIGRVCNAFDKMREELRKSIEKQLEYEENRKELISSISHDLKTPITSIKGYVEGIKDGVANTPEKMDKYLDVIYSKSIDMDRLIDDLFLFSKLDLNRLPFDIQKVYIKRYFDDCVDEIKFEVMKDNIQLDYINDIDENTKTLVDQQKLKRVILNIVQNAVKYIYDEDKKISITLTEDDKEIMVAIKDNGVGIRTEELTYIFDKFYRGDKARNTSIGGSGLGLAISKQIIEIQEGRIFAESEHGKGTTIYFTLKKDSKGEELI